MIGLVERLWISNRPRMQRRFLDVLEVLDALACEDEADVQLGARDAHVLAGALGTYGRPGSDLMKYVEQSLAAPVEAAVASELADRVRQLFNDLDWD